MGWNTDRDTSARLNLPTGRSTSSGKVSFSTAKKGKEGSGAARNARLAAKGKKK